MMLSLRDVQFSHNVYLFTRCLNRILVNRLDIAGQNYSTGYTETEKRQILSAVNKLNDAIGLMGLGDSHYYMQKLILWRKKNGRLKHIEDMLKIEDFNESLVESLCSNILKSIQSKRANIFRKSGIITPGIEAEFCSKIKSCVSIYVGVRKISWSRIEMGSPCMLTNWQTYAIPDTRLHISELISKCLYVDEMIPLADCYVFENPQTLQVNAIPGSVAQRNINMQKAQVAAIIGYALSIRNNPRRIDPKPQTHSSFANVYYLRRLLSSRLFNKVIGSERVSCEQTVQEMIYNVKCSDESVIPKSSEIADSDGTDSVPDINKIIKFSPSMQELFSNASRPQREFLGQSLLLNLAFIQLVLLQDPKCIDLVSQSNKNIFKKP